MAPMAAAQDVQHTVRAEAWSVARPPVGVPGAEAPARSEAPRRVEPRPRVETPARAEAPARVEAPVRVEPSPRGNAPAAASAPAAAADDQRRAEPRGSRPRGDNPATGRAVPRSTRRVPPPAAPVYRSAPRVYHNYYYSPRYYYPRRYYPYGYGAFGLGYFYYNPYGWSPGSYYYGGSAFRGYGYGYPVGELRLRVNGPKDAHVLVDGYYAGILDDYDGIVQALQLEEGPYQIVIVAPGYEPLAFDVRIIPGRKITYRGAMRRNP
jgi:hypothetical protein